MNHPITPPPELVQQWLGTYFGTTITGEVSAVELAIATQAARWGSDQELEACCKWLTEQTCFHPESDLIKDLRAARRPLGSVMTNLSPAAQAVLDAANYIYDRAGTTGHGLAAALRAAADQVVPEQAEPVGDSHDEARHDQWMRIRYRFLAIADELEGQ